MSSTHEIHKMKICKSNAKLAHLVSLFKEREAQMMPVCYKWPENYIYFSKYFPLEIVN